jgi:hypothetical protein
MLAPAALALAAVQSFLFLMAHIYKYNARWNHRFSHSHGSFVLIRLNPFPRGTCKVCAQMTPESKAVKLNTGTSRNTGSGRGLGL